MAIVQNKIDWQITLSSIRSRGSMLYENAYWTDCKFLVGVDQQNQKLFKGHKLILAMSSPVFEIMFYGSLPETETILISDITPYAFHTMMTYLYTDTLLIGSFENAFELYYAAKKYMLLHLQGKCINYIIRQLNPHNVCKIYEFAKMYQEEVLENICLKMFETKTKEVLNNNNFINANLNTVLTIYNLERINIQNELDLYKKLNDYAGKNGYILESKENNEKKEIIKESSFINQLRSSRKKNTLPEKLKEAVRKIRFLTLSSQQLSELPNKFDIITVHEALAIVMNIVSPLSNNFPMPEGFSNIRSTRCNLNMQF